MGKLLQHFAIAFWYDEQAAKRWLRAILGAFAVGGMGFAEKLAAVGVSINAVRIAAVVAGFISLALSMGEKNDDPEALAEKLKALGYDIPRAVITTTPPTPPAP